MRDMRVWGCAHVAVGRVARVPPPATPTGTAPGYTYSYRRSVLSTEYTRLTCCCWSRVPGSRVARFISVLFFVYCLF